MKKRTALLCATLLLFLPTTLGCVARNVVEKVPEGKSNLKKNGVFYALPRTVERVEIPVIREDQKPGKYKEFAECFFPGEKFIKCDKKSFEIGDPVITPRAEPDPDAVFMVKIRGHYLEDRNLDLTFAEGGTLVKGTAETTNRTIDVIAQAAKTGVSLITKGISLDAAVKAKTPDEAVFARDCVEKKKGKAVVNSQEYSDAERTFLEILSLQAQRGDLITLGASAPAETFRLLLSEVDARIKELKEMFLGSQSKKTWNARFEITPLKQLWPGREKAFQLFQFSKDAGVCQLLYSTPEVSFPGLKIPEEFLANCNLPLTGCDKNGIETLAKVPEKQAVSVRVEITDRQLATRIDNAFDSQSESGQRGFYYRIPATAYATLLKGDEQVFRAPLSIAQLGMTASLPSSSGGRRTKYTVELTETGALKNFVLGSDALVQASTVKDFGEAAGAALDARAEAKKAEAAAKDEAAKVKGMADLLAECKKIKEAQEALGRQVNLPKKCLE